ncbi:hypothetical protein RYX36_006698 [Vicia faba]
MEDPAEVEMQENPAGNGGGRGGGGEGRGGGGDGGGGRGGGGRGRGGGGGPGGGGGGGGDRGEEDRETAVLLILFFFIALMGKYVIIHSCFISSLSRSLWQKKKQMSSRQHSLRCPRRQRGLRCHRGSLESTKLWPGNPCSLRQMKTFKLFFVFFFPFRSSIFTTGM